MDHPKPGESIYGGGTESPAFFWTMMSDILGLPVVDESKGEPRKMDWLLSFSIENANKDPIRRQQILDNITKQTGLIFKEGKRSFTTWKLTPAPNSTAPTTNPIGGTTPPADSPADNSPTAMANMQRYIADQGRSTAPSTEPTGGSILLDPDLARIPNTVEVAQIAGRMNNLTSALGAYVKQHDQRLPSTLGDALPQATAAHIENCFLTPADEQQTKIPAVMTADWINQNTSYIYLGGNVEVGRLAAVSHGAAVMVFHTKLDQPYSVPKFGKVMVATFAFGRIGMVPLADAPAAIAESLKLLEAARVPIAARP
jgi:hypothetical protein